MLSQLQSAWNSTLDKLDKFNSDLKGDRSFSLAFGNDIETSEVRSLISNLIEGKDIPSIEILPAVTINGANGAFAAKTNTIYLAQEYLESNDSEDVSNLILEELGHYLDWRLNEVDSPGDEGAIFSALVNGESLSSDRLQQLKTEDDTVSLVLNDRTIVAEAQLADNTKKGTIFYHPTLSSKEINTLAEFANAVYEDTVNVEGWETITPILVDYGLSENLISGNSFANTDLFNVFNGEGDANAVLARQKNTLVLSFRGTDSNRDKLDWIRTFDHFKLFDPLFEALDNYLSENPISSFLVTGHSLGGAMVEHYLETYEENFISAVSFASPRASLDDSDTRLLNIGHENDIVYSTSGLRNDDANSTTNIYTVIGEEHGSGLRKEHSITEYIYTTNRIFQSAYYDQMIRNDNDNSIAIVIDRTDDSEEINKIVLSKKKSFVLAEDDDNDVISSGSGNDVLEGLGGNDELQGNGGRDILDGGEDNDILNGGSKGDFLFGREGNDFLNGDSGNDVLDGGQKETNTGEDDDFLDGGDDIDVAFFSGDIEDYDYEVLENGSIQFSHNRGTQVDGSDNLKNIEFAIFTNRNISLELDDNQKLSTENVPVPGFLPPAEVIGTSPDSVKNGLDSLLLNVGSNLNILVAGLNGFLTTLTENLASNFIENEYPLLGSLASSDNLALISELDFVSDVRTSIIEKLNDISGDLLAPFRNVIDNTLAESLGLSEGVTNEQTINFLEELLARLSIENSNLVTATQQAIAVTFGIPTEDVGIENFLLELDNELAAGLNGVLSEPFRPVKEAIYNAVGEDGINLLQDSNGDNVVTIDDIDLTVDNPNDLTNADVNFALSLGSENTLDTSLATDIGFDGLGLEIDGKAELGLDFDLNLDFGFNQTDEFYLNSEGKELTATLGATIPDLALEGELGFLQVDIADKESNLGVDFSVDVKDSDDSGDNRLTSEELSSATFDTDLDLEADVNLGLVTSFDGDTALPSIEADFNLDWNFKGFEKNEDDTFLGGNDKPTIGFNNIKLDLGSFFSDFAKPIVDTVQTVTQPIQPVIDLIKKEIDIGIFDFTVLEIAETLGVINEQDRNFLESFSQFLGIVNNIPTDDGNLKIDLGDFSLGSTDPRQEDFDVSQIDLETIEVENFMPVEDQIPEENDGENNGANFVAGLKSFPGEGLQFPILTDPKSAIGLLFGQEVDLFTYDLPKLEFGLSYLSPFIPIVGPLGVTLGGEISAGIDLAFGFDTFGLKQYVEAENKDASDIFNGFFVNDLDQDGEDIPEASLTLGLEAFAVVDAAVASAGVGGGIEGIINLNLNDPSNDGKVRINEFEELLDDPECIFDISGEIAAMIRAYVKLGFFKKRFNLARFSLTEFAVNDCDDEHNQEQQPVLATNVEGELTVNIGANTGDRINGKRNDDGELIDEDDYIIIEHLSGSAGNENVLISGFATTQEVNGINKIVVRGGDGNDFIELKAGVLTPAELEGNEGDDFVIGGDGNDLIAGNDGFDLLDGGTGADTLEGGEDDDWLIGGAGADILRGGAGEDTASYGTSIDPVLVNVGNLAENQGDAAEDTFESIEQFEGSDFNDTLIGNENNDVFSGLAGNDSLQGNTGNDSLDGGEGQDILEGGDGDDSLIGGAGADVLEGGTGEDTASYIFANGAVKIDLNDSSLNKGEAEGDSLDSIEIIEATAYEDTLDGSNLSDTLKGFSGNDLIVGRGGDDYLEGSFGNDTLQGDAGEDTLDGGENIDTSALNLNFRDNGEYTDVASYEGATSAVEVDLANSASNTGEAANDEYISIEGVIGTNFDDVLAGDVEDNLLVGSAGSDRLFGREGNDTLIGSEGADTIDGGEGIDKASYARANSAVGVDLAGLTNNTGEAVGDEYISIEEIVGSNFDDVLTGDAEDNHFIGSLGSDRLSGNGGNDTLNGNNGDDTIDGGEGNDTVVYQGNLSQYQIEFLPDLSIQITDNQANRDDSDVLNNVEFAKFGDTRISLDRETFFIFNPDSNPQDLIDAIRDDNAIEIVNNSVRFVGGEDQSSFYNGRLDLGIDNGILLTSGSGNPPTENTSPNFTKPQLDNTDEDLQSVADRAFEDNGGVKDVNTLEFSFTVDDPQVNSISFDLLFGSEEYPEFVDRYVDIAGVFVNGRNVALFNNESTQPLSVIRENLDEGNFIDNTEGILPIEYNGVSSALKIFAEVEEGVNTIKFGIADTRDRSYDSGLFIANLATEQIKVDENGSGVLVSIPGTIDNDLLTGSDRDEFLDGLEGNDLIEGGSGNDVLDGGAGADILKGGDGNDALNGGTGADVLEGGDGNDILVGGEGIDVASYESVELPIEVDIANTQNNVGEAVTDEYISIEGVIGGAGDDILIGDDENNLFIGGAGDDSFKGEGGDDEISGENGNDLLQGKDGDDTLLGGNDEDEIFGDAGDDSVQGGNGDDTVFGSIGNDSLFGSPGNDRLSGDEGNDLINGDDGNDRIFGGIGDDTVSGNEGNDEIYAQAGNDLVSGGSGIDSLFGNDGDDRLKGGSGNDLLTGDAGNDTFELTIGEGTDRITDFTQGIDVIDLPSGIDLNSSGLQLSGNSIIFNDETLATINISAESLVDDDFV